MYQLLHASNGVRHLLHEARGREAKYIQGEYKCFTPKPVEMQGWCPLSSSYTWKNQPVENVQEQGGVYHDILATQVNIRQLRVTLTIYVLHHRLIGGTIPTSLLFLVKNIFTPLVSVLFMECQLDITKVKSLTHEPHACKLSMQPDRHQNTSTNMTVSDRLHSHAYAMSSACIFKWN